MLSPRRGVSLLSPCSPPHLARAPIVRGGRRERIRVHTHRLQGTGEKDRAIEEKRARETLPPGRAVGERYIFPERVAVAKSSQESDKPTTEGACIHRITHTEAAILNVPLEMVADAANADGARIPLGAKGARR